MVLDPYNLLGVNCNSTLQEVRKKYYALASLCHPDRGGTNEDMQVVHDAYCYVRDQVALNRTCSYEDMLKEFEEFRVVQASQPPRFVDIHHETYREFHEAFTAKKDTERAFAEGGYETVMSEVQQEYCAVERGNVRNFERSVVVYTAPQPFDTGTTGFSRAVDGTQSADHSCTVGSLHVSDYREGLAPSPEMKEYDESLELDVTTLFHDRAMLYK